MRRRDRRADAPTGAPVELLDGGHQVWRDQVAYVRWMRGHGYRLPPSERLGVATSPANRRRAAAGGWSLTTGMLTRSHDDGRNRVPDWQALRDAGLC